GGQRAFQPAGVLAEQLEAVGPGRTGQVVQGAAQSGHVLLGALGAQLRPQPRDAGALLAQRLAVQGHEFFVIHALHRSGWACRAQHSATWRTGPWRRWRNQAWDMPAEGFEPPTYRLQGG